MTVVHPPPITWGTGNELEKDYLPKPIPATYKRFGNAVAHVRVRARALREASLDTIGLSRRSLTSEHVSHSLFSQRRRAHISTLVLSYRILSSATVYRSDRITRLWGRFGGVISHRTSTTSHDLYHAPCWKIRRWPGESIASNFAVG